MDHFADERRTDDHRIFRHILCSIPVRYALTIPRYHRPIKGEAPMSFSYEPPSSTDGMSGESQLSFSGGGSVTSVGNNLEQNAVPADGNTGTCTDTSPDRTDVVLGEDSGETKMPTTSNATVSTDEIDLSAPSSLAEMNPDLLRQILGYAQPPDHHLRFEWSGSVGRTCKVFHVLSREDSEYNRGVSLDISRDTFAAYKSIFSTESRPRDLRLAFLQRLVEDELMRARVKELHIEGYHEPYYREVVLPDDFDPPLWRHYRYYGQSFGDGPAMTLLDQSKAIFDSLTVLLSRPNSFPNLHVLDIHQKFCDEVDFELINNELLLALPNALPELEHLCLSNCFFTSCSGCVNSPLGHRPCAMTDISVKQLVEFATSLKTSLRSLSFCGAPWMSDDHVDALLSVVGKDLRVLELINCGLLHRDVPVPRPNEDRQLGVWLPRHVLVNLPISTRTLESIAEHCDHLRILRVLSHWWTWPEHLEEAYEWDVALEAVLRANPELHANDGLNYQRIASLFPALFEFEPTEGSKYAKSSPFAARLSSSIFSCRNDPARVTRVVETAVQVFQEVDLLMTARRSDIEGEEYEETIAAALDAALAEFDSARDEANS